MAATAWKAPTSPQPLAKLAHKPILRDRLLRPNQPQQLLIHRELPRAPRPNRWRTRGWRSPQ
eukprot:1752979-Pyramimonas_sp.AAC.1